MCLNFMRDMESCLSNWYHEESFSLSVMRSPITTSVTQYPSSLADHRDVLERDLSLMACYFGVLRK